MMVEAEVPMVMRIGFGVVTLIFIIAMILLFRKTKSKISLFFFGMQWVFTTLAFRSLLVVLKTSPWCTENVSYNLGLCGVHWGVSICFMLAGVYKSALTITS